MHEHLADAPVVFDGARFKVHALELSQRTGGTRRREVVAPHDAVVILPMLDPETVVLIRNERFAIGQTLWELPAGTLDPGEDPDACAGRELAEETGYTADKMTRLVAFYTTPGYSTEYMTAYLAEGLRHVGQDLDETERITPQVVPLAQTIQMVRDGRIPDAKSVATLLYYELMRRD
jgi:ADP-ribose pyrophosphatase